MDMISEKLLHRRERLLQAEHRMPPRIEDEEIEKKVALFTAQLQDWQEAVEKERKKSKRHFLDGGREVDAFYRNLTEPVASLLDKCKGMLADFKARKMKETGNAFQYADGVISTLEESWEFTIEDRSLLDLESLRFFFIDSDLNRAVDKYVKAGGRQLSGVKIEKKMVARVR